MHHFASLNNLYSFVRACLLHHQPPINARYHYGLRKPVVCAINGAAAGVGLVLACYCDVRFAADTALLTTAHGRLNLPAEYGLSWVLPRMIGLARAADMLLTSRRVTANEAERMGLVNYVVPAAELLSRTVAYAATMARDIRCAPAQHNLLGLARVLRS
jgi:enoyl-CoA hydratase/carnithine racemase